MSLINDYTYQGYDGSAGARFGSTGRDNTRVRLALSGRESWWRRVLSRRGQRRIAIAAASRKAEWRRPSTGSRTKRDPVRRQRQVAR